MDQRKPRRRINKDKIRLYLHPSSIPTKFQTIHYDDNEEKGFNSTTPRFGQQPVRIIESLFHRTICLGRDITPKRLMKSMKFRFHHILKKDMV